MLCSKSPAVLQRQTAPKKSALTSFKAFSKQSPEEAGMLKGMATASMGLTFVLTTSTVLRQS